MLTVMCPNCRHRFPAPGCCNPVPQGTAVSQNQHVGGGDDGLVMQTSECTNNGAFYGGGYLLVPRQYNETARGCFINAPTIIHGPTIIQQPSNQSMITKIPDSRVPFTNENTSWKFSVEQQENGSNCDGIFKNLGNLANQKSTHNENYRPGLDCHINTTCDLTGGTVTITTPTIQSGGCLIHSTDSGILVQAPRIEIRPKLSGGGCLVQKRLSMENDTNEFVIYRENERIDARTGNDRFEDCSNFDRILIPPSGCQELPGTRRCPTSTKINQQQQQQQRHIVEEVSIPTSGVSHRNVVVNERDCCRHMENYHESSQHQQTTFCNSVIGSETSKRHSSCCCASTPRNDNSCRANSTNSDRPISSTISPSDDTTKKILSNEASNGMEIRVNATVQLPPNVGHCTVNITATTGNSDNSDARRISAGRVRNNFNGGGLVQVDANLGSLGNETSLDRHEDAPTTPVSWLMPCPWGFDNYPLDKDVMRLAEIKRLLHTSGWYHEGLSWQQSETLLKNAPVGRWLMRDSSDSRFIFAVSVQTARGPTSVRVHYFLGRFRLDAEPRLSLAMPLFECPIKMLEHYVDYSKRIDEHRKEVWVDYSGQLYSQIYLTKPLVKEVQTLSHLARLVVNSNKLSTDHLPPLMKNYLAEYPYSL